MRLTIEEVNSSGISFVEEACWWEESRQAFIEHGPLRSNRPDIRNRDSLGESAFASIEGGGGGGGLLDAGCGSDTRIGTEGSHASDAALEPENDV